MSRRTIMTIGFVLIFIGIQLNYVESYRLTPRFSNFLSENGGAVRPAPAPVDATSPFSQVSNRVARQAEILQPPTQLRVIRSPQWLCWPVLFLGAVLFLHGLAKR